MADPFDRDAPLGPKMLALVAIGIAVGWYYFVKIDPEQLSLFARLVMASVSSAMIVVIGLGLILRDRTASRIASFQKVSKLERLLFTHSCAALFIWFVIGLIAIGLLMLPLVFVELK